MASQITFGTRQFRGKNSNLLELDIKIERTQYGWKEVIFFGIYEDMVRTEDHKRVVMSLDLFGLRNVIQTLKEFLMKKADPQEEIRTGAPDQAKFLTLGFTEGEAETYYLNFTRKERKISASFSRIQLKAVIDTLEHAAGHLDSTLCSFTMRSSLKALKSAAKKGGSTL